MPVPSPTTRPARWVLAHRRALGLSFILAVGATLINVSAAFGLLRGLPLGESLGFVTGVFIERMLASVATVFLLTRAERIRAPGWRRHLVTVAAASGVGLVVQGPYYFSQWPVPPAGLDFGVAASPLALLLYAVWLNCIMALIARSYLAKSNEEQEANARLATIRSEQIAARRRLIEARLAAIQARIDPQFFFDMLDAVQRTYEVDIDRAESLLDELIVFLRAALPRLRTTSSTVAQECELAKSYARLRTLQGRSNAEIDLVIPEGLQTATFPPGVLLPLVDSVLRAASTERSLLLTADATSSRIVLSLASSARPVPDTVARVEATLADLFGNGAGVTLSGLPDQAVLTTVRVPYEPTGE
jgi:hypothetical protein